MPCPGPGTPLTPRVGGSALAPGDTFSNSSSASYSQVWRARLFSLATSMISWKDALSSLVYRLKKASRLGRGSFSSSSPASPAQGCRWGDTEPQIAVTACCRHSPSNPAS